jgi:tRNA nucleotidyltransferase/poly(A) polymerase
MKATFEDAISTIRTLNKNGYAAFLAGGCVRDRLLGLDPSDYDVCSSATPEQVQALFPKTVPVGASFGVVKVICGETRELDVATFRVDGEYSDNRRPDSVQYSQSAEEDVKRRDFTINALLMDDNYNIIDYVGGQEDLRNRLLRAVGNANDRFDEDALRMMRAIRFATRFRLDIEEHTWDAILSKNCNVNNVSMERITEELIKTFSYGRCSEAFLKLHTSGLWATIAQCAPDECQSWLAILALSYVQPNESIILPLEIIFCQARTTYRDTIISRLKLTNHQKNDWYSLHNNVPRVLGFTTSDLATQRKIMQLENLDLCMRFIDCKQDDIHYSWTSNTHKQRVLTEMQTVKDMGWPAPLINGNDLLTMGFIPSTYFSEMLELVRTKQLNGELSDPVKVQEFLFKTYPALPRKLSNGQMWDDMHYRPIIAQCPGCARPMQMSVSKNATGSYIWANAKDSINIYHSAGRFYYSACCFSRKSREKFVEVKG